MPAPELRRPSALISVLAIAAFTALATAAPASADVAPPTYYPNGPQTSVDQADLTGWTLCYSGLYGDSGVPLYGPGGILSELCTGDYLMLAGGPLDDPILTVLAAAPRADVIFDTTQDLTTTHAANGSEWYFNSTYSWGFALGGDAVDKDECDVAGFNAEYRLCFHLLDVGPDGGEMSGGYRAGAIEDLNSSTEYTRYIYQANGTPVVAPEAPKLAETGVGATIPLIAAGSLLAFGLAIVAVTTVRRRSMR